MSRSTHPRAPARQVPTDRLVVSDAGLLVPPGVRRIDLAVTKNLPSFTDVLRVLLEDLAVERFVLASETQTPSPVRHAEILAMLPDVPYPNIILISRVIYP